VRVEQHLELAKRLVGSARADLAKAAAALNLTLALVGCSRHPAQSAPATIDSVVISPEPAPSALPRLGDTRIVSVGAHDLPGDAAIARKDTDVDRCRVGGGHPVMGFGFTVVCLKPAMVEWESR
jgi:hypothetical protein